MVLGRNFINPLKSEFNIRFSSGNIIMKISKEDKIIFNKDEENNTLKMNLKFKEKLIRFLG